MNKGLKRFVYEALGREQLVTLMKENGYTAEADNADLVDCMIHFISYLIQKVEIGHCDDDFYVGVHSDDLAAWYGRHKTSKRVYYKRVTNILFGIGVIGENPFYVPTKQTKTYGIRPEFVGPLREEVIGEASVNIEKVVLSKDAQRHLDDIQKLTFDTNRANEVVKRLHIVKRRNLSTWVKRWASGNCEARDDDYGRIYSNLTGLNREFRCCLSYNGQELYSVDLKQAHPYLFIKILATVIKQNTKKPVTELVQTEKYADVADYVRDVASANFMDKIYDQIIRNKKKIERKEVKIGVLAEVYYQRLKKNKHKIANAFSQMYPTVWKYIQQIKKTKYQVLAHKLLKAESDVMNKVVRLLYKKHPDGLFMRLHDAIITTAEYTGEVEAMIKEVGHSFTGYEPVVTTTQFNSVQGKVADHELAFSELHKQFIDDMNTDYKEYDQQLVLSFHMKEIDWKTRVHQELQKRASIYNAQNWKRWFDEGFNLRF